MVFSRSASLINLNPSSTNPQSGSRHKDIPLKYRHGRGMVSNFVAQQKISNISDPNSSACFVEDMFTPEPVSPLKQSPPKQLQKSQSRTSLFTNGSKNLSSPSLLLRRSKSNLDLGIRSPTGSNLTLNTSRSSAADSKPQEDKSFLSNPKHMTLTIPEPESPVTRDRSMTSLFGNGSSSANFFKLSSTIIESATRDLDLDSPVSPLAFDDF
ncbi:hypothetical protein GEMRC1_004171 [Eukaryota sp. GEM-RC1]